MPLNRISIPLNMSGVINAKMPDDAFVLFDDFYKLDTVGWSSVDDSGTGTNALAAGVGGVMNVLTAASDNDYHLMVTPTACFGFDTGLRTYAKAKLSLTEANTDDANIIFGFSSLTTSGHLQNNGAGPLASYDGAVFFKVDGGVVWQCETSDAGTQTTTASAADFATATDYILEIYYDGVSTVTFYINGTSVGTGTVVPANLDNMYLVFGVKAGAGNAETLAVDYIMAAQER
jgi:hypothetical protein